MPQTPGGFPFLTCELKIFAHPHRMTALETKGDRTRRRVLGAAERHFAERGFAAARLEDVARDVGLKRAALFYHFPDKLALHDAVLQDALGSLLARLQEIMAGEGSYPERAERAAEAWVDLLAERPTRARLLLRAAASGEHDWRRLVPIAAPFREWMRHELRDAAAAGEIDPVFDDPLLLLGALLGATVPGDDPGPERAEQRQAAVRLTRRLLGYRV